jgi:hypothetical protein
MLQKIFYVFFNSSCAPITRNAATIFTRCSTLQFHLSHRCLFFVLCCNICSLVNYFFSLSDTLHRHTLDAQLIFPPQKAHNKICCRELIPRLLAVLTLTPFLAEIFIVRVFRTKHAIIILKIVLKVQAPILFHGCHNKINTYTHTQTHIHTLPEE